MFVRVSLRGVLRLIRSILYAKSRMLVFSWNGSYRTNNRDCADAHACIGLHRAQMHTDTKSLDAALT